MRLGICANLARLEEAAAAGFEFAEIRVDELLGNNNDTPQKWVERVRSAPLPIEAANVFIPAELKVTGPEVDLELLRKHMELVLNRAGQAGLSIIVFGSGKARALPAGYPVDQGWRDLATAARMAGEIGAKHGVTVVMEPLFARGCNFFNTVAQGSDLVDQVQHPHLQLLADLFHMADNNEPLANIAIAGTRLAHIHVATPALPETGSGKEYDFKGFFKALRQTGYTGRVSVEDNPGLLGSHKPPLTELYRAVYKYLHQFTH